MGTLWIKSLILLSSKAFEYRTEVGVEKGQPENIECVWSGYFYWNNNNNNRALIVLI